MHLKDDTRRTPHRGVVLRSKMPVNPSGDGARARTPAATTPGASHTPRRSIGAPWSLAIAIAGVILLHGLHAAGQRVSTPSNERTLAITERVAPNLEAELLVAGLELGAPVYLRAFKESMELEGWVLADGAWVLFRTWEICAASGELGPKLAEGDLQVPEGFYEITPSRLNPRTRYHLSLNIGYPNAYDRANERTGSYITIHGVCGSSGCLAMSNPRIEEIWVLAEAALQNGQRGVPVHIFPFHMTRASLDAHADHPWAAFWHELEPAYRIFHEEGRVPTISVQEATYRIE